MSCVYRLVYLICCVFWQAIFLNIPICLVAGYRSIVSSGRDISGVRVIRRHT